jgi:hypothetical protein
MRKETQPIHIGLVFQSAEPFPAFPFTQYFFLTAAWSAIQNGLTFAFVCINTSMRRTRPMPHPSDTRNHFRYLYLPKSEGLTKESA